MPNTSSERLWIGGCVSLGRVGLFIYLLGWVWLGWVGLGMVEVGVDGDLISETEHKRNK